MDPEQVVLLSMVLMIFAGVAVLWIAMWNRRHIRELEHRERLAMIDRGLIPPPELDPAGFETRSGVARPSRTGERARSAGVIMIGLGLGLAMLIGFTAGEPDIGVGIGGAFALLGAAFLINALLSRNDRTPSASDAYRGTHDSYRRTPAPSPRPPENPPSSLP